MKRAAIWLWSIALALWLATWYRHLAADFPNYSPWSDWSKFTDEGWYANGAIQHALGKSWFQPGDFNAGVALPVWQCMAAALFHFTGNSLVAARALALSVFVVALVALYFFFRTWLQDWAAAVAVTLLVFSDFYYAFMRLAILEPAVLLWFALLLWLVSCTPLRRRSGWLLAGVLLTLMAFTKTTSLFLVPAPLVLLWLRCDGRRVLFARNICLTAASAGAIAAGYLFVVARSGHWPDFLYLFAANQRPPLTLHSRWDAVRGAIYDGHWMQPLLYVAALAVLALGFSFIPRLRSNPLFVCCVAWLASGLVFIAWHANLQPRYYLTLLPPVAGLVALGLQEGAQSRRRVLSAALITVALLACISSLHRIIVWQHHPQYTFLDAARALAKTVAEQRGRNSLVMSVSSSQLSLMTGLATINDDFGTEDLEVRIAHYDPAWYASWDDPDAGTQQSLEKFYTLHLAGAWNAMDDPDRQQLRLYRLDPLPVRRYQPGNTEEN